LKFSWRNIVDAAKRKEWVLRLADRLGRGRGRLNVAEFFDRPPPAPLRPDLSQWNEHPLAAVWIGHATVLLRIGGKTVLTDPVFSTRVGLSFGLFTAGPRRHQRPAIKLTELPPVDLIVLSHAHFDHLDRPTLARLSKRTPIVTSTGQRDLLEDLGYRQIIELPWGDTADVAGLRVTACPVRHWGARTFTDTHRGYAAFIIESAEHRVLYGADTALHDGWRGSGPVDLAIVGIGAYDPYIAAHASPEQAWQMADEVSARYVLPIHHKTFTLSREPLDEPIARIVAAAGDRADQIIIRDVGGMWTLAEGKTA
jgi:L-ascorbate metabolism protein UlaG (beta-lactamase superfamily)